MNPNLYNMVTALVANNHDEAKQHLSTYFNTVSTEILDIQNSSNADVANTVLPTVDDK